MTDNIQEPEPKEKYLPLPSENGGRLGRSELNGAGEVPRYKSLLIFRKPGVTGTYFCSRSSISSTQRGSPM